MKCLNCGTECKEEYCPKCGQSTATHRFQVKEIIESIIISVVGGDNKLWRTCYHLLYRPGHMVREYLQGRRTIYYKPIRLLLFLVAAFALVSYFFSGTMSPFDVLRPNIKLDSSAPDSLEAFFAYFQALMGNNVYFALFSVIVSVLPYRFVFRKQKLTRPDGTEEPLNIAEHFFALLFQTCFNMLLAFAILPLNAINATTWVARFYIVTPTIYCIILYKQMLGISWVKSIWMNFKAILLSICFNFILIMLIFGLLSGIDTVIN